MSPVPPALFKAKGTTLRADEYLRGVNPVGTVHRGPLSAFGPAGVQRASHRTVRRVLEDRPTGGHPALLPGVLPPGRGQQGLRGVARARVPREARGRGPRPLPPPRGQRTRGAAVENLRRIGAAPGLRQDPRARRPPPAQTRLAQQTGVAVGRERAPAPAPRRRPRRRAVQQLRETEAQHGVFTRTAPLREHRREDHAGRTRPPDPRTRTGRALPIARRVQPRAAGSTRRGRVQAWRRRAADRGDADDGAEGDCRDALPNHRADVATRRGQGRGLDVAGAAGPEHPGPGGVPRDFRFQATGDGPGEPD